MRRKCSSTFAHPMRVSPVIDFDRITVKGDERRQQQSMRNISQCKQFVRRVLTSASKTSLRGQPCCISIVADAIWIGTSKTLRLSPSRARASHSRFELQPIPSLRVNVGNRPARHCKLMTAGLHSESVFFRRCARVFGCCCSVRRSISSLSL